MSTLSRDMNKLAGPLSSMPGRWRAIGAAVAVVGPAMIPISAQAAQIGASFTTMSASVGVALGAYGAVMKGAITQTMEMAKAGKALTPVQKEFVGSVDSMRSAWQKLINETQGKTLDTATHAVRGLTAGIGLLKPIIEAIHPVVNQVAKDFEAWMKGDSARQYADLIAKSAAPALRNLVAAGKDVINVLGDGFRAFLPSGVRMTEVIRDGAAALKGWSDGGGFQRFIEYVNSNRDRVNGFFDALGSAIGNVIDTLKGFSEGSLSFLTDSLRAIASIDPGAVKAFAGSFLLLKSPLAWLVINCPPLRDIIVKLLGGMNAEIVYALAAAFVTLRVAFMLMNTALLTTPLGWVIVGLTALAVAIVAIATKTTWFQTAWKYTWNAIKQVAEYVWDALKIAWEAVVNGFTTAWNAVSGAIQGAWSATWNFLKSTGEAIWNGLKAAWEAVVNGLKTAWDTVSGVFQAAWNAFWNLIKTTAEGIWNGLKAAWDLLWTGMQAAWDLFKTTVQTAWDLFWNLLKTTAEGVWNALKAAWDLLWTGIQAAWNLFKTTIEAAWSLFWNTLKTVAEGVWNLLKAAWDLFWSGMQTAWDTFKSTLQAAWDLFWNAIKTTAEGIWNGIKETWSLFFNALEEAWNTFKDTITEAWDTLWNGLKDTADQIWHDIGEVIQDAINGIIDIINDVTGFWNDIAGAVGLDDLKISEIGHVDFNFAAGGVVEFANGGMVGGSPTFLARGGVIPGYAPGKDTVNAMLSKGEGVLVPEAVRGLGADFVHWANYTFSHGRGGKNVSFPGYATGGILGYSNYKKPCTSCKKKKPAEAFAGGGITAFGRDPQNRKGWGINFFQGGGVVFPTPSGNAPSGNFVGPGLGSVGGGSGGGGTSGNASDGVVGPGGVITGGQSDTGGDNTASPHAPGSGGLTGIPVVDWVLGFIGRKAIEAAFAFAFTALDSFGIGGDFGKMLVAGTKKIVLGMIEKLVAADEEAKKQYESMAVAGAQSCSAWAPMAKKAMAMGGLDTGQLNNFLGLLCAESSGNPNAINNWDINAKNGIPSQGLMQIIPPNFTKYHVAGTSNNILDPLANMAASAAYIRSVYGGRVPGSPYADGTTNATAGTHLVGEEGPELVTSPGYAEFGGGETVLNAADTAALLGGAGSAALGGAATMSSGPVSAGGAGQIKSPDDVYALIQELLASAQQLQHVLTAMWSAVVASSGSSWAAMNSGAFTPLNTNLTGTVPANMLAMQTAWMTGMTAVTAGTQAQWTAMDAGAFVPMNAMMTATVPESAATMQGSVQESWGQMESGTESSWTNIEGSITDSVNAATTPINGLLTGFNNVSSSLGMGINVPLIAFADGGMVPGFSRGGFIPGYAPGRDTVPAMLSKGEGILTPEAVRALGGPSFVHAANRRFAGHRAAGKNVGVTHCEGFAKGGILHFAAGGTVTAQDMEGLAEAGISPGMVTQGSFSTGVAASAGTHDGDGVVDIGSTSVEAQMRNVGWAAWTRGNGDGMSPHTHGVYMKATGIAPAAMGQVIDYINGGTGLGAGSASASDLAGWGLGLGEWNFGPLIKDLVDLVKTNVPERLRDLVRKKLTGEQVKIGFAEKKAAIDAMNVGTGMWADGLHGMGNKEHDGIVDYITSQATSFDSGGWWAPGTLGFNGTRRPELAVPADDLAAIADGIRGHAGEHGGPHIEVNFNGPTTKEAVQQAENSLIPSLRSLMQQGTGQHP